MNGDDAELPQEPASHPSSPRPGTRPSAPSASHYAAELPYAEELQELLAGRYIVQDFLGQGGMGAVYRGLQLPLKRPVAIKILQKLATPDDFDFEERFKREAYSMAALTHPNIVQVYDCGDAGENFLFISMELVEGGDLSDAIKAGQCSPEAALALVQQICDGLQAAHDRGLVHRDIKPANIFLTSDGKAKVADFGLAKKFDVKSTFVTKTGLGMGTPDYAAPEQYEGVSDIDHRADIYSLGVMFYQMLTGSLPRGMFKPASQRVAVDPRLDDVVNKAMQPERHERYQSVAERKADIQHIVSTWFATPQVQPTTAPARTSPQASVTRSGPLPTASRRSGNLNTAPTPRPQTTTTKEKPLSGIIVATLGVVILLAVGAFFMLQKPAPPAVASLDAGPVDDAFIREVAAAAPERQVTLVEQKIESLNGKPVKLSPVIKDGKVVSLTVSQDGESTVPDLSPLGALRDLTRLNVYYLAIADISYLRDLKLEALTIHRGRFDDITALRDMPLQEFGLRDSPVHDYSVLSGKAITSLDLGMTGLTDLSFVKGMPLTRLVIDRTHVTDLSPLRGLPLRDLKCDFVASRDSDIVRSLTTLTRINDMPPSEFWDRVARGTSRPSSGGQPTASPGPSAPSPDGSLLFGGHRYLMLPDILTWTAAKAKAESMGGHLASITSSEENAWIEKNFIAGLPPGLGLWIGGTNDGTPGKWRWVTGEPFGFTDWAPSEPNNRPDELGLSFSLSEQHGMAWFDMRDTGIGLKDRRGGLLVEWDTDAPLPGPARIAAKEPASGAINLLESCDPARDTIEGNWTLKAKELRMQAGSNFSRVAFPTSVPEEYDLRVHFTRSSGTNAVSLHIVLPEGQDVLWMMGGFGNKVCAWERMNGQLGNDNPSTTNRSLETGRRYECLVKVRKNRLQVELDGELISDQAINGNKFDVTDKWRFPAPRKLGVGCQQPTVFHSVELIPLPPTDQPANVAATPAMSGTPPVPATPAPPADPRLAQLETGFKARYEAEVQKPYLAALASLNQSYVVNGISRARAAAQAKGSLAEVTLLDAEVKRIQNNEGVPPTDDGALPDPVKQLRSTYRTALARIEADRTQKALPLYDLYVGALDVYVTELTRADKIDQARQVRTLRDRISADKAALAGDGASAPAGVSQTAQLSPGMASPVPSLGPAIPLPPEATAPVEKGRFTKELVDWLQGRPNYRIGFTSAGKKSQVSRDRPGDVPNGAELWLIDNGGQGKDTTFNSDWLEGQTDLEEVHLFNLDRFGSPVVFRGMKKLSYLKLNGTRNAFTDETMKLWPALPALGSIEIDASFSNQGFRILCERCPQLTRLVLRNVQLAEGGLAPLLSLKNLTYYQHSGANLPRSELVFLSHLPQLDTLDLGGMDLSGGDFSGFVNLTSLALYGSKMGDQEVRSLGSLKKITRLNLANNKITDEALPLLGTLSKLDQLDLSSNSIKGSGLSALESLKDLKSLVLGSNMLDDSVLGSLPVFPVLNRLALSNCRSVNDGTVSVIIKQRSLTELYLSRTAIADDGVKMLCEGLPGLIALTLDGSKITDAGVSSFKRLKKLGRLDLSDLPITDASVEHLKGLSTLSSMVLRNTQITPAGVAEIQKALPRCQVRTQ